VTVAIVGAPPGNFKNAAPLFREELAARPHLRNPSVAWDADRQVLAVTVQVQDSDADSALNQIAEEVFEIVPGLIAEFERFRVEKVAVRSL
jgi:hypothetical protein